MFKIADTLLHALHVCAFFNSKDEEYETLTPYYKEAIDLHEKCLHILDPENMAEHKSRLGNAGIDVALCETSGQLELVTWRYVYYDESGTFDKRRIFSIAADSKKAGMQAGFKRLRLVGDMNWALAHLPGRNKLVEFEANVTQALLHSDQTVLCIYDIAQLSGNTMMDLLRTHPYTVIGGVVQENPFFIPAEKMLEELKSRSNHQVAS